jgi:glutathione peroxidase
VVLGVPSNDFGGQEPRSEAEIKQFCSRTYRVTFPMTKKVAVKGTSRTPLYGYLSDAAGAPGWNFTKYLIGTDGKVIAKFDSGVEPDAEELTSAIEKALRAK